MATVPWRDWAERGRERGDGQVAERGIEKKHMRHKDRHGGEESEDMKNINWEGVTMSTSECLSVAKKAEGAEAAVAKGEWLDYKRERKRERERELAALYSINTSTVTMTPTSVLLPDVVSTATIHGL
ncbi:hypothetical protein CgunFtcFv8_017643 [Champsocephalus gunnari]|uniref:Uncharacterized protein n=1 Tax=Champsocephalus gunnari TaxID=52237 RepID=A0AAN8DLB5_CHAGU|nr:hypothetical protein CgunFtcFv8_017643 [Champsocephalus gunnari]